MGNKATSAVHSRWFNMAVVALWLVTMTWLIWEKFLPQLLIGDRPSNLEIVRAQWDSPPVGWKILMGSERLGWALTEGVKQPSGLTELHGRVHFSKFPLEKMMPGWLKPFFHFLGKPSEFLKMDSLDARSTMSIDSLGNLLQLQSTVGFQPLDEAISVRGAVEAGKLSLQVFAAGKSFPCEIAMPPKALLNDMLSPQSQLPGLHNGQSWSIPVYNPLSMSPTGNPVEILFVTVEGLDRKLWGGGEVNAWRVVYRSELGDGPGTEKNIRGIVWVRPNGKVIQQQVRLSGASIDLVRMTRKEAAKVAQRVGPKWWNTARDEVLGHD